MFRANFHTGDMQLFSLSRNISHNLAKFPTLLQVPHFLNSPLPPHPTVMEGKGRIFAYGIACELPSLFVVREVYHTQYISSVAWYQAITQGYSMNGSIEGIVKNAGCVILAFIVLGSIMMALTFPEAEAQIIPEIDAMVEGPVYIDTSPRGSGLGMTNVTIFNTAIHTTVRVLVTIDVEGYQVSPQSAIISVGPSSSKSFPVAVAPSHRTPYHASLGEVYARMTRVSGVPIHCASEATAGFMILTKPQGGVILQSDTLFQKISPGGEFSFDFKAVNTGNSQDTFAFEVVTQV